MAGERTIPLNEALRAQRALRDQADLGEEQFPLTAFVGMISDEIDALRDKGKSDEEIAHIITSNSTIEISAQEIAENYASKDDRKQHGRPAQG